MPKISTYPIATPTSADKLIGTDFETGTTRNFAVSDIIALATAGSAYDTVLATASGALGGHRAVVITNGTAIHANNSTQPLVSGITQGAVVNGATVTVQTTGQLTEPTWAWTSGPVYLGSDGLLTQSPPISGVIVELGTALTPTTLLIRVQPPIYL